MKKALFPLFFTAVLCASCRGPSTVDRPSGSDAEGPGSSASFLPAEAGEGDTVLIRNGGKGFETRIDKKERQSVVLRFTAGKGEALTAELIPEDARANVRFAQIGMPDGTADGPFGASMEYPLTASGEYTLRIAENTMAGDPWGGSVEVRIGLGSDAEPKENPQP